MGEESNQAKSIFLAAIEGHAPEQWPAFLDQACASNDKLRAELEKLLKARSEMGSFHELPRSASLATLDPPTPECTGLIIGPYKLLEQIGEGGFGVVFMAEQTQPIRRKVALKVLKPGMDTRQVVARFEAERQALAIMDHPNIAKVFDGGATPSGRPFFVMELVKGVPITEYCDQNHLTPRQRLELFIPVCQAVHHAHQKGVIHRDLKPSNVLVSRHDTTPVVKVIDFGVAKAMGQELTDKTLFTCIAQMVGTPLYMSPEQAGMSDLDADTRSDIYSLGVLLYELLTGMTPFDKERFKKVAHDEIRRIIREEEPPKPSTRISTLGQAATILSTQRKSDPQRLSQLMRGELDWIVMKALEKDRNRRYQTTSGLAVDVQRYLNDEPVQACPPSAFYRMRKFVRRNRTVVAAAALLFAALILGTAASTWQAYRASQADKQSRTNYETAEAQRALLHQRLYVWQMNIGHRLWERGELDELGTVLDEFREDDDLKGFEWYWLDAQARVKPRLLLTYRGHQGPLFGAAFSPDGTTVATCGQDRSIHLWGAAAGGHPLILRPEGEAPPVPDQKDENCVSFSPDGRLLASACDDGSVRVWELPSGKLRWSRRAHQGQVLALQFSRDGLFATAGKDKVVLLWDPARETPLRALAGHDASVESVVFSPDGQSIASADRNGVVNVWDIRSEKAKLTLRAESGVLALAFSRDGLLLASGGLNGLIRLWEVASGKALFTPARHSDGVRCLDFSPDGNWLASCSDDSCLRLCSIPDCAIHHYYKAHANRIWCIRFSPDSRRLLTASIDGTARIWEVPVSLQASRWTATRWTSAWRVVFAPANRRLALSTADDRILYGNAGVPGPLVTLPVTASSGVCPPAFSPDGNELAFLGTDFSIRRWRFAEQRELTPRQPRPLPAGEPELNNTHVRLAYLSDNRLAALRRDGMLLLGNGENWQEYHLPCRSIFWPPLLAPLPDGKTIVLGDEVRSLLIHWNLKEGRIDSETPCPSLHMESGYRPDGKTAAFADTGGNIRVVDLASGNELASLIGHRLHARALALSPDGKTLASGGDDGTVRLWNLATGQELFVLEKRAGAIRSLAFSSDGQVLAVAGDRHDDGTTVSLYQTGAKATVADAAPNSLGR